MAVTTLLKPGTLSPRRSVPATIARPFYVDLPRSARADHDDPMVKDADTIARMRVAGRIAADALDAGRINIFERWESDADLDAFRALPDDGTEVPPLLGADVQRYRISSVEPA